jgi:hypothetical protein
MWSLAAEDTDDDSQIRGGTLQKGTAYLNGHDHCYMLPAFMSSHGTCRP